MNHDGQAMISDSTPLDPMSGDAEVRAAAEAIRDGRPAGQVAAIAAQLAAVLEQARALPQPLRADRPVGIGIAGGRLRIAFMHPDMGRFYGPAWQTPIGARDAHGREQIVALLQPGDDGQIHLYPTDPRFREERNTIAADNPLMYPGPEVDNWYAYERFGTRMAEDILVSLGYQTEEALRRKRERGEPTPPPSRWVSTSLRRPFPLVANALASLRTLHHGADGARVQAALGRQSFAGLSLILDGDIPRGGFSSSSAVTLAVQNALNAAYALGLADDTLVDCGCQAEYGTGVRAGSLDQATEQKGRAGEGALISSNPRERYRLLGRFPMPSERIQVLFPYTVDRDQEAWRWSGGFYAEHAEPGRLTAPEFRKMTGKAAEIAAILLRLPLNVDFFQLIADDLVADGCLHPERRLEVYRLLRGVPLLIGFEALRALVEQQRPWYAEQLRRHEQLDEESAARKTDATFAALFADWREPVLRRTLPDGRVVSEQGVPLRAMLAYLFGEVAKNLYLIHHPEAWIEYVSRSQRGDRCFEIDPEALPTHEAMLAPLDWEAGLEGPELLEEWLRRAGARPFDHQRGLDDATLDAAIARLQAVERGAPDSEETSIRFWEGGSFFRGLALVDLAEAMLQRAFCTDAVAVRVNAAGQGDFFQVHVDTTRARVAEVKAFIRAAFYRRFGLHPEQEFVETHPGGGAVGVRLSRLDQLPALIEQLRNGKPERNSSTR